MEDSRDGSADERQRSPGAGWPGPAFQRWREPARRAALGLADGVVHPTAELSPRPRPGTPASARLVLRRRAQFTGAVAALVVAVFAGAQAQRSGSVEGRTAAADGRSGPGLPPGPASGGVASCRPRGGGYIKTGNVTTNEVALTFDDGPGPETTKILRSLARWDAGATFFVLGDRITGRASVLAEELRAGHDVGNHSYTHPDLRTMGEKARPELERTSARIYEATGFKPCLFRPPFGGVNARLVKQARELGMLSVGWDVDTGDYNTPATDVIVERVLSAVKPGSIVLLHDGTSGGPATSAAVPKILRGLRKKGYRSVPLTQLLGLQKVRG